MKKSTAVVLTLITTLAASCSSEQPEVNDNNVAVKQDTTHTKSISSTPHHTTVYPWYLFWRNWGTPKPTPVSPKKGGFGTNGLTKPSTS